MYTATISPRRTAYVGIGRSVQAGLPDSQSATATLFAALPRRLPRRPLPPPPGPTPPPPPAAHDAYATALRAPNGLREVAQASRDGMSSSPWATTTPRRSTLSMCSPSCRNSPGCQPASRRSRRCALRVCPASSDRRTACPGTPGPARIGGVARIAIFGQMLMLCPHIHISGARVEVSPGGSLEYA